MLDESLFVSDTIHEREVELADGTKHKMHFKELPAVEYSKFFNEQSSDDADIAAGAVAKLISAGLCTAEGKKALTYEQALRLKAGPMNAIFSALMEVNGTQGKG